MLHLGNTAEGGRVELSDDDRARHVHIIGASGGGKSKLLEHLIRQDISRERGLCLVDPHGTLCNAIEAWCAARGMSKVRRIHLIKPGDEHWTAGFNPLRNDGHSDPAVRVDAMVDACAEVWGGQDMNQTPRLRKVLRALFFALTVQNLTLAEALYFLSSDDPDGSRRALTKALPDPVFGFVWDELNKLSRREFTEYTESTTSRVTQFLSSPAVRLMVGQQRAAINFREVMDRGEIVLVNLGSRANFSPENASVVGALLLNDLLLTALGRDEQSAAKPFTLYMDEAYAFLNGDVEQMLDQTRKFGLHLVIAHHRLGQLRTKGESIFNAVMANARTKIVFGGLPDEDAAYMARELLRSEVDLEEPKHVLDKPTVVRQEPYWFRSESSTESEQDSASETHTTSSSATEGESAANSQGFRVSEDEADEQVSASENAGTATTASTTDGRSSSHSWSTSRSESEGRVEGRIDVREILPTAVYSLEEQLHRAQSLIRELPDRSVLCKRIARRSVVFRTVDVNPPLASTPMLARFREAASLASPYVAPLSEAKAEVAARQRLLERRESAPAEDEDFWAE